MFLARRAGVSLGLFFRIFHRVEYHTSIFSASQGISGVFLQGRRRVVPVRRVFWADYISSWGRRSVILGKASRRNRWKKSTMMNGITPLNTFAMGTLATP